MSDLIFLKTFYRTEEVPLLSGSVSHGPHVWSVLGQTDLPLQFCQNVLSSFLTRPPLRHDADPDYHLAQSHIRLDL